MTQKHTDLYKTLNYTFKDETLLIKALTLGFGNVLIGYERLEFLGDRVLGLVVARMIFETYPLEEEGDMARRHSDLVRAETLAKVAEKLDLGSYFIVPKSENSSVDRSSKTILSDVCEALIAGLYLDGGLEVAQRFVETYWTPLMQEFKTPPVDAKTKLQEWAQSKGLPLPAYSVVERTGADHEPLFTIAVCVNGMPSVSAKGSSKRIASQEGAEKMLALIEAKE